MSSSRQRFRENWRTNRGNINNSGSSRPEQQNETNSHNNSRSNRRFNDSDTSSPGQQRQTNNRGRSRGRGQHDGSRPNNGPYKMGFKYLENLENTDDVQEILQVLLNENKGFQKALAEQDMNGDFLVLILRVLVKIIETPFIGTKLKIYDLIFRNSSYLTQLRKFILDIPTHDKNDKRRNNYFWSDTDAFWYNIMKLSDDLLRTPTLASDQLPKLLKGISQALPNIEEEHNMSISKEIVDGFASKRQAVENLRNQIADHYHRRVEQPIKSLVNEDELLPPEDFRTISVYPRVEEVTSDIDIFLRKNKINGPYKNVEHYLDVQFRLLREDFVLPLRNGITQYFKDNKCKKFDDVRIYKPIRFLKEENINELRCFKLKYDFNTARKSIKYENSKQFMYGSLMCFTKDNFKNIIFGKIVQRDLNLMKNNEIIVGFHDNVNISFIEDYIMVESKVYFEPYYCVLTALQTMATDRFPLERYIVYAKSDLNHPSYLRHHTVYNIDGNAIYPLMWGNSSTLYSFNPSQQEAFKAALTRELSVIQGPPGTGKTYLGLKVAKTLIDNCAAWYEKTPMLVICYTNHALDQFLEGLVQITSKILRIGGQSKNESLNQFNMRNQKIMKKSATFYQMQRDLKASLMELADINNTITSIKKYDKLISFSHFGGINDFNGTWYSRATPQQIKDWLFEEIVQMPGRFQHNTLPAVNIPNQTIEDDDYSDDELSNLSDEDRIADDKDEVYNIRSSTELNINYTESLDTLKEIIDNTRRTFQQFGFDNDLIKLNRFQVEYNFLKHNLEFISKLGPVQFNRKSPHLMSSRERWTQYKYFLDQYLRDLELKQNHLNENYQEKHKLYSEQKEIEDLKVMKQSLAVGMTTTSAARLRRTLIALKSPIVIVEEAAEVMEAHITSALTQNCNQLILIGDHKQLRPKAASYKIETDYEMGISLFERMINNNVQCHSLNIQHRMVPEICDLIRPSIYPKLEDHSSVHKRPRVVGVEVNLYFIDHMNREEPCGESSKMNKFESIYLIKLAKYLILNGCQPENITILAAYLGQMFEMQRVKKKYNILRDVRVSVLDNYQGEENDIILLSLVRNNEEKINGFLKIENRICVALSRARNGLYIMGNMNQLCNDKQSIWLKVRDKLQQHKALGPSLQLKCQLHGKITKITDLGDFSKVEEGGCDGNCDAQLACGHKCKRICHMHDRDHNEYICTETCGKPLCTRFATHLCEDRCFEPCRPCYYKLHYKLPCMHDVTLECHVDVLKYKCIVRVPTTLPCGHVADKPCHEDANTYPCPHPCEIRVEPCGHACSLKCHIRNDPDHIEYKCKSSCAKIRVGCSTQEHYCRKLCYEDCEPCTQSVRKARTVCSHFYNVPCNSNVDDIECKKPCAKKLPCGHKCSNICMDKCGPCKIKVSKAIGDCGHKIEVQCFENPTRKDCKRKCERTLQCGHKCLERCRDKCTEKCLEKKICSLQSPCGHIVREMPCFEYLSGGDKNLLKYCKEPCNTILKCNHDCQGSCGECLQGRIHKRCLEKCDVPLICNHPCPNPCREACKPCQKKCTYSCIHSKCNKICGDICTRCTESCPRQCQHQRCKNACGDICSVKPCKEPCPITLKKCGHPCVGFCSDPCPSLCRICDNEELTSVFFGTEDEEDARFVQLTDCKHIIESSGMEKWLENDEEIQAKVCPICKTPIVSTRRYSDYVKQALKHIHDVKLRLNGTSDENDRTRELLLTRLKKLLSLPGTNMLGTVEKLNSRLELYRLENGVKRRQYFNTIVLNSITSKTQLLEHIVDICRRPSDVTMTINQAPQLTAQVNLILDCILRDEEQITKQEIEDIQNEIDRLKRMMEIQKIRTNRGLTTRLDSMYISRPLYTGGTNVIGDSLGTVEYLVMSFNRYTEETDDKVFDMLKKLRSPIQISEKEKRDIVQALGLSKGHWYKCPNGHPYVITECGGAMEKSVCPECKEGIGGTSHTLLPTNRVATEMDGATHSAWSDAANMNNYRFD